MAPSILVDDLELHPAEDQLPKLPVVPAPDLSTPAARGAYLARMAACNECHTPAKRGARLPGMDFAGGTVMSGALQKGAEVMISRTGVRSRVSGIVTMDGERDRAEAPDAVTVLLVDNVDV